MKLKHTFSTRHVLGIGMALWLLVTVPALTQKHVFRNFEPYPDGLFYVGQARQAVLGNGWQLRYRGQVLPSSVPPWYSLSLVPLMVVWPSPDSMYLSNVLFGLVALVALVWCLKMAGVGPVWQLGGMLLYLAHGYIINLPALPMAENIALPVFMINLALVLKPQKNTLQILGVVVTALALMLTKYAYVSIAGMSVLIVCLQLLVAKQWRELTKLVLLGSLAAVVILGWFAWHGENPLYRLTPGRFNKPGSSDIVFYSWSYVIPNLRFYVTTMFGQATQFLWHTSPLTGFGVALVACLTGLSSWRLSKQFRNQILVLTGMLISLLPVFSIFYVHDARYVIMAIPLLCIIATISLVALWQSRQYLSFGLALILVGGSMVLSQKVLWRQLVAANILGRSTAWQYEAVLVFNQFFQTHGPGALASNLLPYYVDLYQDGDYRIVPVSQSQKLTEKRAEIWGADIDYTALSDTYAKWINDGQSVFITNAYLGHEPAILSGYEQLQSNFETKLVQEGCLGTCNIYQLISLKKSTVNN